jgi:endonuclease/exonuclease/phosphatase family metal-dependent hydrolase
MAPYFKVISWNLKDFGDYERGSNLNFIVETLKYADIVAVQEVVCNRFSKRLKVGLDEARSAGVEACQELADALATNDPKARWHFQLSRVNCTNQKRDAYAFFWKADPIASKYMSSELPPLEITIEGTVDIVSTDTDKQFPDRRPCVLDFLIDGVKVSIFNFHASVGKKTSIDSCRSLTEVDEIKDAPNGIICGDFNVNFRDQFGFDQVYKFISEEIGYEPSLGSIEDGPESGIRTSIGPKQSNTDYLSSAYDNILVTKSLKRKREGESIDIIEKMRRLEYSHINESLGRRLSMQKIYPKTGKKVRYGKRLLKVSCISDHIPVVTDIDLEMEDAIRRALDSSQGARAES